MMHEFSFKDQRTETKTGMLPNKYTSVVLKSNRDNHHPFQKRIEYIHWQLLGNQ